MRSVIACLALLAACREYAVTTPDGLEIEDLVVGTGAVAANGDTVVVNYVGWLQNGEVFDSTLMQGRPYELKLGANRIIKGWDQGIPGMRAGGKRRLVVPGSLGYGERGVGNRIPPNATLIFEVELVDVRK